MKNLRRTKIVCTLGPATSNLDVLREMIEAGMDVARLNFSHGTHDDHAATIAQVKRLCGETGRCVALLQDLCGPKIRVGEIADGPVTLSAGDPFTLTSAERVGDARGAHVSYAGLAEEVGVGARVLIDDGLLELTVESVTPPEVTCRVVVGGPLSSHKGVNFPGIALRIPALTEKDREDVRFGLAQGVDMVALSFVQRPDDIFALKDEMALAGRTVPIISKIEKGGALQRLDEIIEVSDGIMVARGDLGVETPMERLPLVQKQIITRTRSQGKPVITATQMLDSMIRNPRPTRAEVTDVANAILDGTDAVMLSGETAAGAWPVEAVRVMASIAQTTESELPYDRLRSEAWPGRRRGAGSGILECISLAACEMAEELEAEAIVVFTSSGRSARKTAQYRPRAPVLALTDDPATYRQLRLSWGVYPVVIPQQTSTDSFIREAEAAALESGLLQAGDLAVLSAGYPVGVPGSTNTLQVQVVGRLFLRGRGIGTAAVVSGPLAVVRGEQVDRRTVPSGSILAVERWTWDLVAALGEAAGLVVAADSVPRDALALVRERALPLLVGVAGVFNAFQGGERVTLDVGRGIIYV